MQINLCGFFFVEFINGLDTDKVNTYVEDCIGKMEPLDKVGSPNCTPFLFPLLIKAINQPNSMIKIDILQQIIDVHRLLCVFKRITQLMIFNPRNGEIPLRRSFLLYVNIVCIFLQVLRLICIQSYCNNGLKTKVLDYYKREIIQVCVI